MSKLLARALAAAVAAFVLGFVLLAADASFGHGESVGGDCMANPPDEPAGYHCYHPLSAHLAETVDAYGAIGSEGLREMITRIRESHMRLVERQTWREGVAAD